MFFTKFLVSDSRSGWRSQPKNSEIITPLQTCETPFHDRQWVSLSNQLAEAYSYQRHIPRRKWKIAVVPPARTAKRLALTKKLVLGSKIGNYFICQYGPYINVNLRCLWVFPDIRLRPIHIILKIYTIHIQMVAYLNAWIVSRNREPQENHQYSYATGRHNAPSKNSQPNWSWGFRISPK